MLFGVHKLTRLIDKLYHSTNTTTQEIPASLSLIYFTTLDSDLNLCLAIHSICLLLISNTSSPSYQACSLYSKSSKLSSTCSAPERASASRRESLLKPSVVESKPLDICDTVLKPVWISFCMLIWLSSSFWTGFEPESFVRRRNHNPCIRTRSQWL